ncbi:CIC11C00000001649 [Sungouiella intermedia]|uniref:CIC11C00000000266 n=1 Tax=Sungouiella intermedia TaxID=45354 RepID=A0A1L0CZM8_9ASCO|nr:CIC11C00000001649 [[Candida] intermedia]SGZ53338.1 CIC11C00000000266 [[Candida] intermedia]
MNSLGLRSLARRAPIGRLSGLLLFSPLCPVSRGYSTQTISVQELNKRRPVNVDRELPDPFASKKQNRRYFWVYAVGVTVLCALIFNYEKTRSPIVNSVLYCLRRSEAAKNELGANIGFKSSWPWIWGTLNTVKGNIDIEFDVCGDKSGGKLKLKASRTAKFVPFDVEHFVLEVNDGTTVDLMKDPTLDFDL